VARDITEDIHRRGTWRVRQIAVEELDPVQIDFLAAKIAASPAQVVVTAESHYVRGGFGSALSDALCAVRWRGSIVKWGIAQTPTTGLGSLQYMVSRYCPSISDISDDVIRSLPVEVG
jgi:transketolase C-terminal domain/subunit